MKVTLRDVTKENFRQCVKLKVAEDQKEFVASNVYSIAESKIDPVCIPKCIYAEEELVGFTMYGQDEDNGTVWIIRLMIDEAQQGKGYGKAAMKKLIELLPQNYGCTEIYLSTEPHNTRAQKLYESLGFVNTGRIEYGEVVFELKIHK